MHDSWVVAIPLGLLIGYALLGKSKPKWHPFGGVFTRDRKTGAITMALTLPTKRSARKRRKR
jgi:hypothetical protein